MQATGVILAGGKSERMKFNKAFARINDDTIFSITMKKFQGVFPEILIISNQHELYGHYAGKNIKIYSDIYQNSGPIAGIHSALTYACYENIFLLGCDMPFMNMELACYLLNRIKGYEAAVPRTQGVLQATAAVYNRSCLPFLEKSLDNKWLKLTRIFEGLSTIIIEEEDLIPFGSPTDIFFNVNDQAALVQAREMSWRLLK